MPARSSKRHLVVDTLLSLVAVVAMAETSGRDLALDYRRRVSTSSDAPAPAPRVKGGAL
jgi:hypothetical protein